MINDPIVEEVRRYRKEHSARYDNDINKIVEALRKKERESTRTQLNPGPKFLLKKSN
jgi:spore coat polysaccharide biosynthesis predicted glycosyltransferase SpsG